MSAAGGMGPGPGGRRKARPPAEEPATIPLRLTVNGERVEVSAPPHHTLLEVLREEMGLTGTKHGCELGECGTCTVLVDGRPVLSCLVLPRACEGRPIVTVEGLQRGPEPDPLQRAFAELGAAQCGYCTPGFLLAARDLLDRRGDPTRDEIREALSGNLCRCTGYIKIYEAVELAARRQKDPTARPSEETLRGRT
ncbi:MAG TPA: (2Fe-2S)-binding protein [Candidatus Polarisedimenticolia bacterium]|nr:(2Fe-2S)-binding protein [Candidatus Polarisedimenticolia bacterium]